MKKNVIAAFGFVLLSTAAFANPEAESKFNVLHREAQEIQKVDEFASWNGDYVLQKGSRACKQDLEFTYLMSPTMGYNHIYVQSENGRQSYSDYLMNDLTAQQFRSFQKDGVAPTSTRMMYGLTDDKNREVVYTYGINKFTTEEIDINIKFGRNNYNMKATKLGEEQIRLEIDDNTSLINRVKGIVDWERIRSRLCFYKKLDRDFSGSNRYHE